MHIAAKARLLRFLAAMIVVAAIGPSPSKSISAETGWLSKLDPLLQARITVTGRSRVIVRAANAGVLSSILTSLPLLGGRVLRRLPIIDGAAIELANSSLPIVAANPLVLRLSLDRVVAGAMERTGATVGAAAIRQQLGYDGRGVGIAVIDSGVTSWHDDLADADSGGQRVDRFVDLVNGRQAAYDDYGHGTHVAGIIAGNGFDSGGARSGIAPGAHLIVLKVLDDAGRGRISNVIAALDYVMTNRTELNIRVVNLSVAAGVYESYNTDPLTLAAQRVVRAGTVVVAAAGNNGRSAQGTTQYAGITAPGNAPWVLTVGASSHMGTTDRADDTVAVFSSRGPSAIDYTAKPDLVAPGVGIESLSDPGGRLYATGAAYLLSGTVASSYFPYMSLSGTSMAAPVAAGTIALMLQANPALTPNAVKAILQYTTQVYEGYDPLTQGAGFLNAKGAVELARYLAATVTTAYPSAPDWSGHLVWGNHLASGGRFTAAANAWSLNVTWGDAATSAGERIAWGVMCSSAGCDAPGAGPWQTACLDLVCGLLASDAASSPNVVWGAMCAGADCPVPWNAGTVSGTTVLEGDTVVWGTSAREADTVVWGTNEREGDTVVWGTSEREGDTVVWGTSCTDPACEPVVWNRP
jgi:serine protease AprX